MSIIAAAQSWFAEVWACEVLGGGGYGDAMSPLPSVPLMSATGLRWPSATRVVLAVAVTASTAMLLLGHFDLLPQPAGFNVAGGWYGAFFQELAGVMVASLALLGAGRFAAVHGSGRGTGAVLVGVGAMAGVVLPLLASFGFRSIVCLPVDGGWCRYASVSMPLWQTLVSHGLAWAACVSVLALVALLGRPEVLQWLRRGRLSTPIEVCKPAVVALLWCAASAIGACAVVALAALEVVADAGAHRREYLSMVSAYGKLVAWEAGMAVALASVAALIAVLVWRGRSEFSGQVRTWGGLACIGYLWWALAAVLNAYTEGRPIAEQLDYALPMILSGWSFVAFFLLLISLVVAALSALALLVTAGLRTRM